jgi:hypothetical protein
MSQKYDSDKTFVILTSVITLLIALAGTALGMYHAIDTLGMVGLLPAACYIIYDIVNAWAVYIDYKEDGTPLEWASWIVKGIACIALLFIGGVIGSQLIDSKTQEKALGSRTEAMQRVYNDCIAQNPKALATCRKLAESSIQAETKIATDANKGTDDTIKKISAHPLFHYSPGFLGVGSLILLGLVKKLSKKKDKEEEKPNEKPQPFLHYPPDSESFGKLVDTDINLTESLPKAYFDAGKLPKAFSKVPVSLQKLERYFSKDGRRFYKLIKQESGYQVRDHQNEYCGHIGWQAYEKLSQDGITYDKIVKALKAKKKGGKSL